MGKLPTKTMIKPRLNTLYYSLLLSGYLLLQYCYIPSFKILGIVHEQPTWQAANKALAFAILTGYSSLLIALWGNTKVRYLCIFLVWGAWNNFWDEITNHNYYSNSMEVFSFIFALSTLIYSIWSKRQSITRI